MEYSLKGEQGLKSSDFLQRVAAIGDSFIRSNLGERPEHTRNMILFANGMGSVIAEEFDMKMYKNKYFHVENCFGKS